MNKHSFVNKLLTVIQGTPPGPDGTTNNCSQEEREVVNLKEESADEQAIKALARDFAKALTDRNFEALDGRAEYHLYTVDHLIELIKNNDEQNTIRLFNENKIKSRYEDCKVISINFSADQEQAEVIYDIKTCVLSAEDKFYKELNKNNNKKNRISGETPFNTTYKLLVKKEKGTWKVDKFEASEENKR